MVDNNYEFWMNIQYKHSVVHRTSLAVVFAGDGRRSISPVLNKLYLLDPKNGYVKHLFIIKLPTFYILILHCQYFNPCEGSGVVIYLSFGSFFEGGMDSSHSEKCSCLFLNQRWFMDLMGRWTSTFS